MKTNAVWAVVGGISTLYILFPIRKRTLILSVDCFVPAVQVATGLISRLVALYLDDNATTDAISAKLRNLCPSLYSADDAVCSKANELIFASKALANKQEKDKSLREALALFKSIAGGLMD